LGQADDDPARFAALADYRARGTGCCPSPDLNAVANARECRQRMPGCRVRVNQARARRGMVGVEPEDRISKLKAEDDPAVAGWHIRATIAIDAIGRLT
jgi:hypothetical protein